MTKKTTGLIFIITTFSISFLLFSNFNTTKKQTNTKNYQSKTINHSPNVQEGASMKLAWYRFFNVHQAGQNLELSTRPKLVFSKNDQKSKSNLIVFNISNQSSQDITLPIQNGSLIMIQEAQNDKGDWQPIEYWCYDWGQGSVFDSMILKGKETLEITAPKYEGDFKTKIRFKLKTGQKDSNDLYYSEAFEGNIDKSQFNLNQNNLKFDIQKISYLEK